MKYLTVLLPTALAMVAIPSLAQQAPDAGRVLTQNAPRMQPPAASSTPVVTVTAPRPTAGHAGQQVLLKGVRFSGDTTYSEAELLTAMHNPVGKSFDFAGLEDLARSLTRFYQTTARLPFAHVYLPPQDLSDGILKVEIVKGRHGKVSTQGDPQLAGAAQKFLSNLHPGAVITGPALERSTLILNDQPGIKSTPIMRPGAEAGTGDLIVDVQRDRRYSGEVGVDNSGNRYTGKNRMHVNATVDSSFMLGDQFQVQALHTDADMWAASFGYSAPIGASGLRGQASHSHSYYALVKDFSSLDATGTADVTNLGLYYPLVRSQNRNLGITAGYQHKRLHDRQGATDTDSRKSGSGLPISLGFDATDQLYRSAITYGTLNWTQGRTDLDAALDGADRMTARTAGSFNKFNLDLARIQSLLDRVDLYGRLSAQRAGKNLDSSEKFGLGGPNGVRAYPTGEAYGDDGYLTQLELRYVNGNYMPFAFYDAGKVKINHAPWEGGSNHRSISGQGVGMRYANGPWTSDVSMAWRGRGGAPQSETGRNQPALWFGLQYKF